MKKTFLIFFTSFAFLFLIFNIIQAQQAEIICNPDVFIDESNGGENGLVPCGNVNCCKIDHIFILLNNIFNFIVRWIAIPLAILMITIGGVMILISAGNPNLANLGKNILRWAIIGLVLVFCSWVIINFILTALGYQNIGSWNIL